MPDSTSTLPILDRRLEIEEAVRRHQVVVVCGETGSGKTTQLPQICLAMNRAGVGIIVHTQPRRIAARAVAARIAEERGESVGGSGAVGVKIRFHDQTSRHTRIKIVTDGMLLAELGADPRLRAYSTIIIDEAHERSLNIDFLLGYIRQLLPARPDLRLIVTSATIDPRRFSDYFGGPALAPVIEVSGRTFPIEIRHHATDADEDNFDRVEFEAVADAVEELTGGARTGDVLVFLPGEREIRMAGDAIARRRIAVEVLPLFSRLTNQEQDRIFHPSTGGRQRVILATNVAETSLTVPGIRYVIDTGLARISRYDPSKKIQRLPVEPISRASSDQRAGRCGRVAAGVCVRLFSEESYRSRPVFTDPEIRRTSLASVILQMKSLGGLGAIEEFPFLDAPDAAAVRDGYETLFELGAITAPESAGELTPIGRQMSSIPLDPRIARMLLGAEREGVVDPVTVLAAVLSIQDPRERPMGRQEEADRAQSVFRDDSSDFMTLLKLWDQYTHAAENGPRGADGGGVSVAGWCREHFLSAARMREWGEMVRQLRDIARDLGLQRTSRSPTDDAIHRALLTGLISNVACREGDGSFDYRGVRGNQVQIFPGSALFEKGPRWIMAAEIVQTTRLYARTVARVDPAWVEELAGHMFRRQLSDHHLDPETGQPSAWERVSMSGIVVVPRRRTPIAAIDPRAARTLFIREGLALGKLMTDAPFMAHNRSVLERARTAEARLRRRDVLVPDSDIVAWFDRRVPQPICDPASFESWRSAAEQKDPRVLMLDLEDVVQPAARRGLDPSEFPDAIELGEGAGRTSCPLTYALAPGRDEDGVTVAVGLTALPELAKARAAWLVPGMLSELVQALLKTLPKPQRAAIESKGGVAPVGAACAEALAFGNGMLTAALSEALDILFGITIPPGEWSLKALPAHLRLRIRVVDHTGVELAADRDAASLLERLQGRIRKARAAGQRSRFDRRGLKTWDFGELPHPADLDSDDAHNAESAEGMAAFPALIDDGDSVWLTLAGSARDAAMLTRFGLRRLFAIACEEEVGYYLDALPQWSDLTRQFGSLGSPRDLRDQMTCIIADRVFLDTQAPLFTRAQFEERLASARGRLAVAAREVGEVVARILEPRFRVAHRIAGGTPRLWAESVADIREQAVYLMPRGFLGLVPWERLRRYPKYAELMRDRLFALREDGSKVEAEALRAFLPHWKRFTAWVAAAMGAERASHGAESEAARSTRPGAHAPLPQARRAGAAVNLEAGEWAIRPGRLTPPVERYRWALEELRLGVFTPHAAGSTPAGLAEIDRLWTVVTPP